MGAPAWKVWKDFQRSISLSIVDSEGAIVEGPVECDYLGEKKGWSPLLNELHKLNDKYSQLPAKLVVVGSRFEGTKGFVLEPEDPRYRVKVLGGLSTTTRPPS